MENHSRPYERGSGTEVKKERNWKVENRNFEEGWIKKGTMKEGFFKRRLVRPILDLLRQGVTPEKIALSVAMGAALGMLPALGLSTTLCAIAAFALRLNLPAIQIVNYFVYPAQIALLVPFFRWGEKLFRRPVFPDSRPEFFRFFPQSFLARDKAVGAPLWARVGGVGNN